MKRFFFLLVFISLCSFSISAAQDFWRQADGTEGGNISLLVVRGDGTAFASDGKSLFRRALKDAQWSERTVPKDRIITAIIIDAYGAVIIGTDKGVYRSATEGDSWGKFSNDTLKVEKLFYDVREGLFALYDLDNWYQLYHFKSEFNAWQSVRNPFTLKETICFDSAGVWYVASDNGSGDTTRNRFSGVIQRSFDKGKSWKQVKSYSSQYYLETYKYNLYSLLVTKNNQLWLGVSGWYYDSMHREPLFGGLFSAFTDESWKSYPNDEYYSSALCLAQDSIENIFIGSKKGVYKIQNDSSVNIGLSDFAIHSLGADKFGNIYAVAQDDGIYFLKAGATEWGALNEGLKITKVNRILKSPNGEIYAAISNGLFTSQDNGKTWTEIYKRHTTSLVFDGGKIFAGNDSGDILYSADQKEWSRGPSANSRPSTFVYSVAFKDSVLLSSFRGRVLSHYQGRNIVYDNGGVDRFPLENVPEWKFPRGNNIMLYNDSKDFFAVESGTFYGPRSSIKTSQDGIEWKIIFSGPIVNDVQFSLSNNLYLATDSGIYRRDGEKIFTKLNFLFKTTVLTTANDGVMYAASGSKVYRSADEWQTWEDVSKGMRGEVTQLAVTKDGFLLAGTRGNGLFVSNQRTYSALKITNVVKECGRHTVTIEGDSLNNFIATLENVKIDVLKTLPASTVDVLISHEDRFKNGSYDLEFSDALGRKVVVKDSFPKVIPPVITQHHDTLFSSIPAQSYGWMESGVVILGETKEFLKLRKPGVYSLKIIDTNNCELLSESLAVMAVGIENDEFLKGFSTEFLKENDEILITIPGENKSTVSIISLNGEVLFKKECSVGEVQVRVSASQFSQGVYFVRYTAGNDSFGRLLSVIK